MIVRKMHEITGGEPSILMPDTSRPCNISSSGAKHRAIRKLRRSIVADWIDSKAEGSPTHDFDRS